MTYHSSQGYATKTMVCLVSHQTWAQYLTSTVSKQRHITAPINSVMPLLVTALTFAPLVRGTSNENSTSAHILWVVTRNSLEYKTGIPNLNICSDTNRFSTWSHPQHLYTTTVSIPHQCCLSLAIFSTYIGTIVLKILQSKRYMLGIYWINLSTFIRSRHTDRKGKHLLSKKPDAHFWARFHSLYINLYSDVRE